MRFLLINHEYTISGASLLMLRLARHLVERGNACDVMATLSHNAPLRARYAALGIRHLITADFKDYDVVIANTIFTAPIVSPAAKFAKTIWWIHEGENALDSLHRIPAHGIAFSDATAIVFQTEHQRNTVYRSLLGERRRVFVIPVGIDVSVAGPGMAKTRPFRIVSIGTIDERKRHSDLIRAVAVLARDDVECVIVGRFFWLDDEARAIATDNPAFRIFAASHENALAWLRSADLFCLPSSAESQPVSVLEAAALAKPLVITDLPSYRGIWRHGENCLLFPVGDIGALTSALSTLLESPDQRARLGSAARTTAGQFTGAAFLSRFDAVLDVITQPTK